MDFKLFTGKPNSPRGARARGIVFWSAIDWQRGAGSCTGRLLVQLDCEGLSTRAGFGYSLSLWERVGERAWTCTQAKSLSPGPSPNPLFYTTDYYRGFALQPGAEGQYQREGESYVRINSDGLRDREHAKTKPADTIRVAVLGDSYAEALQVGLEDGFVSVLEGQMQNCQAFAGKSVEIINFGVSGYGTAQELITLRRKVWEYSPDIVLLASTTNNDISDNARVLKKTDEVPYFVWRDGNLLEDDSFRLTRTFRWRSSALIAPAVGFMIDCGLSSSSTMLNSS